LVLHSKKLLAIILIVTVVAGPLFVAVDRLMGENGDTSAVWPPLPLRPPLAHLVVENDTGAHIQEGVMIHYDWTVKGELERYTVDLPWPMPESIAALQRGSFLLRLGATAPPVDVKISRVSETGLGTELPSVLYSCQNILLASGTHNPCDLTFNRDEGVQGWEVIVPLPLATGKHFLLASVIWAGFPTRDDLEAGGQSGANWLFSIEKS